MKKLFFFINVIFYSVSHLAQQVVQYSNYLENSFYLNPAVSHHLNNSLNILYRNQWVGFEGSPKTTFLSYQSCLSKLKDVTIYTFLYPLAIHPEAMNKSKKIWCSGNKTAAWNNYMLKNMLPKNDGNCATPIEENLELAKKLGISSTPTIIVSSGKRIEGALPYEDIVKYID